MDSYTCTIHETFVGILAFTYMYMYNFQCDKHIYILVTYLAIYVHNLMVLDTHALLLE